jgi:FkbM family methyltransferase
MSLFPKHAALLRAEPLCIVDVGARGGLQDHWQRIREHCLFVGFEPEPSEAERLKRHAAKNELYVSSALYSAPTTVTFHHCVVPARSSLYPPDPAVVADIYGTADHYRIERTEQIQVTTLDAAVEAGALPSPDFIKLDTQGSELDILKGAEQSLGRSTIAIESEVEFIPLYKGQPLFVDVDAFLRAKGYELMKFSRLYSKSDLQFGQRGDRGYRNAVDFLRAWGGRLIPPHGSWVGKSQLVYADVLYVRRTGEYLDFAKGRSANPLTTIVKAVVLATESRLYGYASEMLEAAKRLGLIGTQDSAELERFVRIQSRELRPLLSAVQRQSTRLWRRLRSPQRNQGQ